MNNEDIKSLAHVCGILTERHILEVIEENKRLKEQINELKKYEKPKINKEYLNMESNFKIYDNKKYIKWRKDFTREISILVIEFCNNYITFKRDLYNHSKDIFFDTNFCLIIDCFINYFEKISKNIEWAKRISNLYLTSIAFFLSENLKLEKNQSNLEHCLLLTLDNIIFDIIIFELE